MKSHLTSPPIFAKCSPNSFTNPHKSHLKNSQIPNIRPNIWVYFSIQFLRPFGAPDVALTLRGMPPTLNQGLTDDLGLEAARLLDLGLEGARLRGFWRGGC